MLRLLQASFLLVFVPGVGKAACHAVGPSATGSGSGADWNNVMSLPSSNFTRGDVYYLRGGSYSTPSFSQANSGTTEIELRSATATDHCTDTGWGAGLIGQSVFTTPFTFTSSHWIINGQSRNSDWRSGYGIKIDRSGGGGDSYIIGDNGTAATDLTFKYLELAGDDSASQQQGLRFVSGSSNITFSHGYIHDPGNTIFQMRGIPNFTAEYNYLTHNNETGGTHSEACSCSEGMTNMVIRYNKFVDIIGTTVIGTPSGGDWYTSNSHNGPWYIYGNLIYQTGIGHCGAGIYGVVQLWDVQFDGDVVFVNNTIDNYNVSQCGGNGYNGNGIAIAVGYSAYLQNLIVENNLWSRDDTMQIVMSCDSPGLNYRGAYSSGTAYGLNDLVSTGSATGYRSLQNGNTGNALTNTIYWQSLNSGTAACNPTWDYNSYYQMTDNSASGDTSAHKQTSSSSPFVNFAAFDYHTISDTSAGVNLGPGPVGQSYNLDADGVIRGASGMWDRGLYQLPGNSVVQPNPPTGLSASVQ
jgi:hypothetical protein